MDKVYLVMLDKEQYDRWILQPKGIFKTKDSAVQYILQEGYTQKNENPNTNMVTYLKPFRLDPSYMYVQEFDLR